MRVHFSPGVLLLLWYCLCTPLAAQEVIVVKTRSIPIVEDVLSGFQAVCSGKQKLTIYDMQGNRHQGQVILAEIQDTFKPKEIKAVFTIGLPAANLIKQSMANVPMVFSMVRDPEQRGLSGDKISGIPQDPSADMQLRYLTKTLPEIQRVAIIYSHKSSSHIDEFEKLAGNYDLHINRYPITSVKELPKTLRQVIIDNDALILIPDKMVINQASLEYFVTTILENGFPTFGYNQFLVESGILMALVPNYFAIGQQAGNLLCDGNSRSLAVPTVKPFNFVVNAKTAKRINAIVIPELLDIADHVY